MFTASKLPSDAVKNFLAIEENIGVVDLDERRLSAASRRRNRVSASLSPQQGEGMRVRGGASRSFRHALGVSDLPTPHPGPLPVDGRGRTASLYPAFHEFHRMGDDRKRFVGAVRCVN